MLVTPTLPNFPISFPIQLIRLLTNWATLLLGKYVVSRKPEVLCKISGVLFECVKICKIFKRNWVFRRNRRRTGVKLAPRKQWFLGTEGGVCAFQRTGDQNELSGSVGVLHDFPGKCLRYLHREKNLLTLRFLPYKNASCLKDGVEIAESFHPWIRQTTAKNISVIACVDQRLNPQYPVLWVWYIPEMGVDGTGRSEEEFSTS